VAVQEVEKLAAVVALVDSEQARGCLLLGEQNTQSPLALEV
jgi:hypothetical protein